MQPLAIAQAMLPLSLTAFWAMTPPAPAQAEPVETPLTVEVMFLASMGEERPELSFSKQGDLAPPELRAMFDQALTSPQNATEQCNAALSKLVPKTIKDLDGGGTLITTLLEEQPVDLSDFGGDVMVTLADEEKGVWWACHFQDPAPFAEGPVLFHVAGTDTGSFISSGARGGGVPWIGDFTDLQITLGMGGRERECCSMFDCDCAGVTCAETVRRGRGDQCGVIGNASSPRLYCTTSGTCFAACEYTCPGSQDGQVDVQVNHYDCSGDRGTCDLWEG